MDARRSQVYNALFLAAGEGLQRVTPDRAIGLDQLGEELKKVEKEKIVVGDGARLCYNTLTEQGITLKMAPEHLRMQCALGVTRAALDLAPEGGMVFRRTGLRRGAGPRVLPPVSGGAGAAGAGS